jgi:hypothetical protein
VPESVRESVWALIRESGQESALELVRGFEVSSGIGAGVGSGIGAGVGSGVSSGVVAGVGSGVGSGVGHWGRSRFASQFGR